MDKEVLKAGCILINMNLRQVGLVYRKKLKDYSFAKGHLEKGETLKECAVRETEEETGRACRIVTDFEYITAYEDGIKQNCKLYTYIAIDEGVTSKEIAEIDKEMLVWKNVADVSKVLTYANLKKLWQQAEPYVQEILKEKKQ